MGAYPAPPPPRPPKQITYVDLGPMTAKEARMAAESLVLPTRNESHLIHIKNLREESDQRKAIMKAREIYEDSLQNGTKRDTLDAIIVLVKLEFEGPIVFFLIFLARIIFYSNFFLYYFTEKRKRERLNLRYEKAIQEYNLTAKGELAEFQERLDREKFPDAYAAIDDANRHAREHLKIKRQHQQY